MAVEGESLISGDKRWSQDGRHMVEGKCWRRLIVRVDNIMQ